MRNKFQIGKGIFGRTLKEKDRHKHLSLSPISKEGTRRFWLKNLQMEFVQPCSSIIVTRDSSLVAEVEKLLPNTKQIHYIDPDRKNSLSLNPLFHSTKFTAKWLTSFFIEDGTKSAQLIFMLLAQIAIIDTHSEKSLAYIFKLVSLGSKQLKEFLSFQASPFFIAARLELNKFSEDEQERMLQEIYGYLAPLQTAYAQTILSEQKFYTPILFHEFSVVIVYLSPEIESQDLLLRLLVHSMVHQIIDSSSKNGSGSIYLHLDGLDLVPFDYLSELQASRLGVVCLSDAEKTYASRSYFHINIESANKGIMSTLKTVQKFRPVMIPA